MTLDQAKTSCMNGNKVRNTLWASDLYVEKLGSDFLKTGTDTLVLFWFEYEDPESTWELYSE